ncbi:MAG: hypothetical protein IKB47_02805 [Clostridia bacterium]|nr:hypothetical protein [Clostridia bacterium]
MRDFYFYTSRPMTAKDCFDSLNNEIKNIRGTNNLDEVQISVGGKWRSYLWFYNERFEDYMNFYESEEEFEADKDLIPIKEPYINFFEAYRSVDAKRFIAVLMRIYPELYVEVNEMDYWHGTAQEYLDTEFDY